MDILDQVYEDVDILQVTNDQELFDIVSRLDDNTTIVLIEETTDKETENNDIKAKYKKLTESKNNAGIDQAFNDQVPSISLVDQIDENNNDVYNQESENNEKRGRKRKRQVKTWKQNIRKRQRQSGQEYTNTKGKKVPRRKIENTKGCKGTC